MNILVVDDDNDCRNLLRDLLANETGMTVSFASDGAHAWWRLSDPQQTYDLLVSDIRMPEVDGLALLERIRATPHLRQLPVIVCSGVKERPIIEKAVHLNITHYVVKPYLPATLLAKIRSLLPPAAATAAS